MPGRRRESQSSQPVRGKRSQTVVEETIIEDEPSQSQSAIQAQRAFAGISEDIVNKKVNELVQYMLIMDQKKYPVKRADINKVVLKEHSKSFLIFIEKAKSTLQDVFGLDLIELDSRQKTYILTSMLDQDAENPEALLELSSKEKSVMGLLVMVLTVIFMKGNAIKDDELYYFLKKLGVDIDVGHAVFGDVKKLLNTEFVRQGYLDYQRLANMEPLAYEVRWGPRAKHEVSKMDILNLVCQVYHQEDPSIWTTQFQDATAANGV